MEDILMPLQLSCHGTRASQEDEIRREGSPTRRGNQDDQKSMSHSQTLSLSRNLQSMIEMLFFPRVKRKTNSNHFENFLRTLSSFVVKLHRVDVNFLCREMLIKIK